MHITTRIVESKVLFIEEIDFLVQTIVLQCDDEFIGYIFRYFSELTELLQTNITGVHEIFSEKISQLEDTSDSEIARMMSKSDGHHIKSGRVEGEELFCDLDKKGMGPQGFQTGINDEETNEYEEEEKKDEDFEEDYMKMIEPQERADHLTK